MLDVERHRDGQAGSRRAAAERGEDVRLIRARGAVLQLRRQRDVGALPPASAGSAEPPSAAAPESTAATASAGRRREAVDDAQVEVVRRRRRRRRVVKVPRVAGKVWQRQELQERECRRVHAARRNLVVREGKARRWIDERPRDPGEIPGAHGRARHRRELIEQRAAAIAGVARDDGRRLAAVINVRDLERPADRDAEILLRVGALRSRRIRPELVWRRIERGSAEGIVGRRGETILTATASADDEAVGSASPRTSGTTATAASLESAAARPRPVPLSGKSRCELAGERIEFSAPHCGKPILHHPAIERRHIAVDRDRFGRTFRRETWRQEQPRGRIGAVALSRRDVEVLRGHLRLDGEPLEALAVRGGAGCGLVSARRRPGRCPRRRRTRSACGGGLGRNCGRRPPARCERQGQVDRLIAACGFDGERALDAREPRQLRGKTVRAGRQGEMIRPVWIR